MNFSQALQLIKDGDLLTRKGWNGKGMFVFKVDGSQFNVSRPPLNVIFPEGTLIKYNPHLDIRNADGNISTWVPSSGDLFAEDWLIKAEEIVSDYSEP